MNVLTPVSMFPKQVKIETVKARVFQETTPPSCTVTRERGGLEMDSKPIRLDLDNRAFFGSIGFKSIDTLARELVAKGKRAVAEGTARYCVEGDLLATGGSMAIKEIARIRTEKSIDTMLVFIPEHAPEINWKDGYVEIEYTPDRLRFSWQTGEVNFNYQPFDVRFNA